MKQFIMVAGIVLMQLIASCRKDTATLPSNVIFQTTPMEYYLSADIWVKQASNSFAHTFFDFPGNDRASSIEVYLEVGGGYVVIPGDGLIYLAGKLTYRRVGTDLIIDYNPFNSAIDVPFRSLQLKLVVK